jgi:hypothetical protein
MPLLTSAAAALVLVFAALIMWCWASREGVYRFSAQHLGGAVLGLVAVFVAAVVFVRIFDLAGQHRGSLPGDLSFLAPVQQSGSALSVEVANVSEKAASFNIVGRTWPALVALALFVAGWLSEAAWKKSRQNSAGPSSPGRHPLAERRAVVTGV